MSLHGVLGAEPLGERVAQDRGTRAGARGRLSPKNIKGASAMKNGEATIKKSFIVQNLQTNSITPKERK